MPSRPPSASLLPGSSTKSSAQGSSGSLAPPRHHHHHHGRRPHCRRPLPWAVLALGLVLSAWGVTRGRRACASPARLHPAGDSWLPGGAARAHQQQRAAGQQGSQRQQHPQPHQQRRKPCQPAGVPSKGELWGAHCQRLRNVCVDQSTLVFYDERYQETAQHPAEPLPEIKVSKSRAYFWPWRDGTGNGSTTGIARDDGSGSDSGAGQAAKEGGAGEAGEGRRLFEGEEAGGGGTVQPSRGSLPPLRVRPASAMEPRPYLQDPDFSACTVPIVVYPVFANNFGHVLHDVCSFLYALLRRTPWRAAAKLVVVTPEGLGLPPPAAQLMPALAPNLSVQSWADFSARLPPGYAPEADRRQPPASVEGGERRCFADLFVCGQRFHALNPFEGAPAATPEEEAAALRHAVPREDFAFGQAAVEYVLQQQALQQAQQLGGQRLRGQQQQQQQQQGQQQAQPRHAAASAGRGEGGSGARRLKVLFMQRDGEARQLLNAEELVEACNSWQYTAAGGGAISAECWQVTLPNLEAGVAAAQEADVFVGVHGANMPNSWLMRPGSSTIEISPYQFWTVPGSFGYCKGNAMDPTSRLLWWLAVVCDPALSTPGPEERAGTGNEKWWPRDRSVRVPWQALVEILEEVVAAGGDRERYIQQQYLQGRHRFNLGAEGVLSRGAGQGGACPA